MIEGLDGYPLTVYTIMCKKCRHIYYIPTGNSYPYEYCPFCKVKLNLKWE